MLIQHPQIYMPKVKEPSYFVPELWPRKRGRRVPRHPETLDDYLSLFDAAGPGQRAGEGTPSYLWSRTAAGLIAEVQPAARIIALLREPASFLRSLHLQFMRTNVETEKDLRRAIELEPRRRNGEALPRNSTRAKAVLYSEHIQYVEQLRRYHAVFPPEHVLVLIYDDFRADNEGTVRQVQRFLEVDDSCPIEAMDVNPAVSLRSPRLYEAARAVYMGREPGPRAIKQAIKGMTPQRLRHRALGIQTRVQRSGRPEPEDEQLMLELRRRFKGEVTAASEYLDRDLVSLWGYDRLD
jgi:Sulfotransferase family